MPLAAMLPAACTTPTRICCSCCSDQSAAPASAAGTAAARPAPTSRRAFSAPPVKSRMLADSHAPAEDLDQDGMHRVAEPDPVQRVPHLPRPDQPGQALTCGYDTVEAGLLLETGDRLHGAPGFPRPSRLNPRPPRYPHGPQLTSPLVGPARRTGAG